MLRRAESQRARRIRPGTVAGECGCSTQEYAGFQPQLWGLSDSMAVDRQRAFFESLIDEVTDTSVGVWRRERRKRRAASRSRVRSRRRHAGYEPGCVFLLECAGRTISFAWLTRPGMVRTVGPDCCSMPFTRLGNQARRDPDDSRSLANLINPSERSSEMSQARPFASGVVAWPLPG